MRAQGYANHNGRLNGTVWSEQVTLAPGDPRLALGCICNRLDASTPAGIMVPVPGGNYAFKAMVCPAHPEGCHADAA